VHDTGGERGAPFLTMELVDGPSLRELLSRPPPFAERARLALELLDGAAAVHGAGIVHRDVKPENIFIAKDQQGRIQPKVLDFGIAKLNHDHALSRLTQVGDVMGSPYYLSPEQAEGLDDIDFRSDIWSIGVVLYEAVCGAAPFEAPNYNALIRSILRDAPKPMSEHAAGDAQLWTIIERCLRKDREERWGSMWELGESLALWLFERGVRVDAASRSLRHGWLDGNVTGLQILVPSDPPSAPPAARPTSEPPADSSVDPGPLSRTFPRLNQSRVSPALLAAAVFALAALLFVTRQLWLPGPVTSATSDVRISAGAGIPEPMAAEERVEQAVPRPVVPESPNVPTEPSAAASHSVKAELSATPGSSATPKAASKRTAPRKQALRASGPAPAGTQAPRVTTEFGF
jgi:serine/threonine-protein kinase